MCKVSSQLRFCTCKATSTESLKHYWIFHRYVGDKGISIMGTMVLPYTLDPETELYNTSLLLQRVNDPTAFDLDLHPQEKDRLSLTFHCTNYQEGHRTYGFQYHKGKWVAEDYDPFKWEEAHLESVFGILKPALEIKVRKSN